DVPGAGPLAGDAGAGGQQLDHPGVAVGVVVQETDVVDAVVVEVAGHRAHLVPGVGAGTRVPPHRRSAEGGAGGEHHPELPLRVPVVVERGEVVPAVAVEVADHGLVALVEAPDVGPGVPPRRVLRRVSVAGGEINRSGRTAVAVVADGDDVALAVPVE